MSDYLDETREWICNVRIISGVPAKYTPKWELVRCKDCKHYEQDAWVNYGGMPIIGAHDICNKWGNGCKTDPNGYCFFGERKQMDGTSEEGDADED